MYKAVICLLSAELCFASSTVFGKFVTDTSDVPVLEITFFRFFFGFFLALIYLLKTKSSFRPNRWDLVFWRSFFNVAAIVLVFLALRSTTVTNANMLNMTYPAFLFAISPLINGERSTPIMFLFLGVTITGSILLIHPDFQQIRPGDIYGLLSGISAAFGVATLKKARNFDSSGTIIFYIMLLGVLFNGIVMIGEFRIPTGINIIYVLVSALLGVLGQAFFTYAYLYISARAGGLVSSSRILFATALGFFIFSEKLTQPIVLGGMCILGSIIGVTWQIKREMKIVRPG